MLHVVLLFIKILGIVFFLLAGMLLLILCSVLFAAVSYEVKAEKEDTCWIAARGAWLFRIITVRFRYDRQTGESPVFQVRLLGFPLWKIPRDEKPGRKSGRLKKKRKKKWKKRTVEKTEQEEESKPHGSPKMQPVKETAGETDHAKGRSESLSERPEVFRKEEKSGERPDRKTTGIFQKISGTGRSICDKIRRIWEKIIGIGGMFRRFRDKKDVFLEFWNLEEHQRARKALWKHGLCLWKKSKPKKIRGRIVFGFSDPSYTGLCMGAIGMLCAWYPDQLQIAPDFEQEILKGSILIRGRIRCYIFARVLWNIYFNKNIRHMYQHWQEL